jgi:hypothetical protein
MQQLTFIYVCVTLLNSYIYMSPVCDFFKASNIERALRQTSLYLMTLISTILWIWYGILIGDSILVINSIPGIVASLLCILLSFYYHNLAAQKVRSILEQTKRRHASLQFTHLHNNYFSKLESHHCQNIVCVFFSCSDQYYGAM